jgi:hypothetical protein
MPITLDHVKAVTARSLAEGVYKRLEGRESVAVYVRETPLRRGTTLQIGRNRYKVEKDAYLVYVNLMHHANYSHPVIYELHNVEDGSVRMIEEEWPIADREIERTLIPHILPREEGK